MLLNVMSLVILLLVSFLLFCLDILPFLWISEDFSFSDKNPSLLLKKEYTVYTFLFYQSGVLWSHNQPTSERLCFGIIQTVFFTLSARWKCIFFHEYCTSVRMEMVTLSSYLCCPSYKRIWGARYKRQRSICRFASVPRTFQRWHSERRRPNRGRLVRSHPARATGLHWLRVPSRSWTRHAGGKCGVRTAAVVDYPASRRRHRTWHTQWWHHRAAWVAGWTHSICLRSISSHQGNCAAASELWEKGIWIYARIYRWKLAMRNKYKHIGENWQITTKRSENFVKTTTYVSCKDVWVFLCNL